MLRSILEKWSRGIILKKRVPAEFGARAIYVSTEDGGLGFWKPVPSSLTDLKCHR